MQRPDANTSSSPSFDYDREHFPSDVSDAHELFLPPRKSEIAQRLAHLGYWEIDLATHRAKWSHEMFTLLDCDPKNTKLAHGDIAMRSHPEDRPAVAAAKQAAITKFIPFALDFRVLRQDGTIRWMHSRGRILACGADSTHRLFGTLQDITERKEAEERVKAELVEVRYRAEHDALTALLNRSGWEAAAAKAVAAAQAQSSPYMILLLDLNHFKFFNDAYGHACGDTVLCHVADGIRAVFAQDALCGRLGGDEFAIAAPIIFSDAMAMLKSLKILLARNGILLKDAGTSLPISVAGGIATLEDSDNLSELTDIADTRMYRDKSQNRDSFMSALRERLIEQIPGYEMLDSVLTAIDERDRYTLLHSELVLRYALLLGRSLELSEEDKTLLKYAALLHDLGKIIVPERLLKTPQALTPRERSTVHQYPVVGASLVQSVPELASVAPIIRSHRERWDGKGYPDALLGTQIPQLARILAIADAYAAMLQDRPYRPALSPMQALDEIVRESGTAYAPEVVAVFQRAILGDMSPIPM